MIAIIALLVALLAPALSHAKQQGKRAACLSNQRQLLVAWTMYADDNRDFIVNGLNVPNGAGDTPWVGAARIEHPVDRQRELLGQGALAAYNGNVDLYRCPVAKPNELRTYSTVHAMNGHPVFGPELLIRKRSELLRLSDRIVFVDDYMDNWDASWTINYRMPSWWNPLPFRHAQGTTVGLADAHAETFKWTDPRSIAFAREDWITAETGGGTSKLQPGNRDIHKLTRAAWGGLGYDPK